ncbi:MAG: hypothetical protein WC870_03300 [Candidatus Paceibacterota bacterium]
MGNKNRNWTKIVAIILGIIGIVISLCLFYLSAEIRKAQDTIDDYYFTASIFTSNHNLLLVEKEFGIEPPINSIKGAYNDFYTLLYDFPPAQDELNKINTMQDYLKMVNPIEAKIASGPHQRYLDTFYYKNKLQEWEKNLIYILVISQLLNLLLTSISMKKKV